MSLFQEIITMVGLEVVLEVDFHLEEVPLIPLLVVPWEAEVVSSNNKKIWEEEILTQIFLYQ
jgi:hypothetical protein